MIDMFDRIDAADLTAVQIAPLEALLSTDTPDTWRDLATSLYTTLLSAPGSGVIAPTTLAHLAIAQTMGIAQDMGGTQPYIPVGAMLAYSAKARRVIDLINQGMDYREVGRVTGVTPMRVRQIEREWRLQQIALRQGRLNLD